MVKMSANREYVRIWLHFWAGIGKGNAFEFESYTVEQPTISKNKEDFTLKVIMKRKSKTATDLQVGVKRVSPTEILLDTKNGYLNAPAVIDKILGPSLWDPFDVMCSDHNCKKIVEREEGNRHCRVCPGEMVPETKCKCCSVLIHKKCAIKGTCKNG